jgi:hypothetical protein
MGAILLGTVVQGNCLARSFLIMLFQGVRDILTIQVGKLQFDDDGTWQQETARAWGDAEDP